MAWHILTGQLILIGLEKSISNLAEFSQKSRRIMQTPPYLHKNVMLGWDREAILDFKDEF